MKDIVDFLLENDFEIVSIEPCTEEDWNNLINDVKPDPFKRFKEGNPLSLEVTTNPNFKGIIRDNIINYQFAEVKENEYQGHKYYLPAINGKGKRVKGKKIIITDYSFNEETKTIFINLFEIEKG